MTQSSLWAGIDAGKAAHHCVVINGDGRRVLSKRVANDEIALLDLIPAVNELDERGSVQWAIDLNSGGAALLITLLCGRELIPTGDHDVQQVVVDGHGVATLTKLGVTYQCGRWRTL